MANTDKGSVNRAANETGRVSRNETGHNHNHNHSRQSRKAAAVGIRPRQSIAPTAPEPRDTRSRHAPPYAPPAANPLRKPPKAVGKTPETPPSSPPSPNAEDWRLALCQTGEANDDHRRQENRRIQAASAGKSRTEPGTARLPPAPARRADSCWATSE